MPDIKLCDATREMTIERLVNDVQRTFSGRNLLILLYGSSVERITTSDIDVCIILPTATAEDHIAARQLIEQFHISHGLPLDEEVPFSSKLIYTYADVDELLSDPPFEKCNWHYRLSPIRKTEEFLASKQMKYRLLLNILTTNSQVIHGDVGFADELRRSAWKLLVVLLFGHVGDIALSKDELVNHLCVDLITGCKGEMFLGYEQSNGGQFAHLGRNVTAILDILRSEGEVSICDDGRYRLRKFTLTQLDL